MALRLRQTLNLSQQLIMTPQLQQAIKLLQLSRLELLDTINQEMEENPLLDEQQIDGVDEEKDDSKEKADSEEKVDTEEPPINEVKIDEQIREDIDWETYLSDYNTGWAETPYNERDLPSFENMTSSKTDLSSHLMWQLSMSDVNEVQRNIGIHIIGNIDEHGYLKISVEELAQTTEYSQEEVSETLSLIQLFDPVGIAARDTRECLMIQIRFHDLEGSMLEQVVMYHMDNLENKKYDRIAKSLAIPIQEVLSLVSIISDLEPKPGRMYCDDDTIYISPDIYVFKVGDNYEIVLNEDGMPKLKINNYYRDILYNKDSLTDSTKQYIQEKLKSAAWLIKSIHQRQRTIYKVIHTPQGVFELKYFFNSSINGIDGESIASESVKEHIKNIVKSENKAKPYSDQEVADMLKDLNVSVARRTVAKYRENMGILPSRKRRMPY